uniref:Lon proteolytic domain-containing protein n=1 Tax=Timema bartmani TaxID=61472 RepID=A0A7R9FBB0_9NEOP|nr:unnamed protein product [Timema bartmani]
MFTGTFLSRACLNHFSTQLSTYGFSVSKYTLEAGVRSLERRLAALCRDVAVKVAEKRLLHKTASSFLPVIIDIVALEDILGPPFYLDNELWSRVGRPGVAVGLAWSTTGAQVMIVEVSKMEGTGELILTGYLGRVMKESAKIALNWVRTAAIEVRTKVR